MPSTYTDTPTYKGTISLNTGLFINGHFVHAAQGGSVESTIIDLKSSTHSHTVLATGKKITSVTTAGTKEDVDLAVKAAEQAYKTSG
ncbi:hypothetical protein BDZ89DRAFT_1132951 [Hymenopellis radicata]|nr:hypothetical protein BDZ89DRAFT_1132951 [Hymenopellis radicata]